MSHSMISRRAAAVLALGSLFLAVAVSAHAKLTGTTPKADSTVSSPQLIQIHFNEPIATKLSSLKLAASDGTAVAIMSMNDAKDPATLSVMPNARLKPGAYKVTWKIVSDDGHKEQGTFSFKVK